MAKLSLQEQLLKAGLVNEKKLNKAKKGSKKSRDLSREVKASVEVTKQAQAERAKELNDVKKEQVISKELKAQVKQLIEMNKIDIKRADIKYNFTDGTLIRHIYVDDATRKQLIAGVLAIARYESAGKVKEEESYAVIPSIVANKIAQRDEQTILENKIPEEEVLAEDDPYADFVVPDDLMW
jgi:uncharacterized protein YaiL (DUF2058 family)